MSSPALKRSPSIGTAPPSPPFSPLKEGKLCAGTTSEAVPSRSRAATCPRLICMLSLFR